MTETKKCRQCTMTFNIGPFPQCDSERLQCPDCGLPFWTRQRHQGNPVISVGVLPENVKLGKWADEKETV